MANWQQFPGVPEDLGKLTDLTQMQFYYNNLGISTGDSRADMFLNMAAAGMNIIPPTRPGQSVYDAYLQRQRSKDFVNVMKQSFGSSLLLQRAGGFNTQSTLGSIVSMIAGNPDGLIDNPIVRAFNGGNPVKAQMGLMANITGMTSAMGYGQPANITAEQSNDIMQQAYSSLFKSKTIGPSDVDELRRKSSTNLISNLSEVNKQKLAPYIHGDLVDYDRIGEAAQGAGKELTDILVKALNQKDEIDAVNRRVGTKIYQRTNVEAMRGFEIQDFTKSYAMALDLGLYTPKKGAAPGQTEGDFFKHAGGVLAAVRDLTGASTGGEAMEHLNSLFGNSTFNMGDADQAKEATMLIRNFKAAARAAGISISSVMGILSETRALASQHPELQYMGGQEQMQMAIRAVTSSVALSTAMGQDWVRKQGGQKEVARQVTAETMASATSPTTLRLQALAATVNESQLDQKTKDAAIQQIMDYANNPNSNFFPGGEYDIFKKMAAVTGQTVPQLYAGVESMTAKQAGVEFNTALKKQGRVGFDLAGENEIYSSFKRNMIMFGSMGKEMRDANGNVISPEERFRLFEQDRANAGTTGRTWQQDLMKYGYDKLPIIDEYYSPATERGRLNIIAIQKHSLKTLPAYAESTARMEIIRKKYAEREENLSIHSKIQGDFMGSVAQMLLDGSFGEGIAKVRDTLSTPEAQQRLDAIATDRQHMGSQGTLGSFLTALYQLHGGDAAITDEKVLRKNLEGEGLSPSEITTRLAARKAIDKKQFEALDQSSLTLGQIEDAATKYEGSAAQTAGTSQEQIMAWHNLLRTTNLLDAKQLGIYKGSTFASARTGLGNALAVNRIGSLTYRSTKKEADEILKSKFDEGIAGIKNPEEIKSLHKLLDAAHLIDYKEGDLISDSLDKLVPDINTGMYTDPEMLTALMKEGAISTDPATGRTTVDKEKLRKIYKSDGAEDFKHLSERKGFAKFKHGAEEGIDYSSLDVLTEDSKDPDTQKVREWFKKNSPATLEDIESHKEQIGQGQEAADAANKVTGDAINNKLLTDLSGMLGTNSDKLVGALEKISGLLSTLSSK